MEKERLSRDVMYFLKYTWRDSTRKVYSSYLRKWATFCIQHNYDMYEPENAIIMDFLFSLIRKGASYSAVNTARCALSAVLPWKEGRSLGCNEFVCMLIKALGNFRPPRPRYSKFWDVNLVLNLFRRWGRNTNLSTYRLTLKVTVLLLLLTAQRGQTIWRLNVSGLEIFEDHMSFKMKHMLKHNRPGEPLDTIMVPSYPRDALLCPVRAVRAYLRRTRLVRRREDQLLLITRPPFSATSRDTISRWTKQILNYSGIDTDEYGSHSTRGAATSMATTLGIDMNTLIKQASWKNAETFAKYYNKTIQRVESSLAHIVIEGNKVRKHLPGNNGKRKQTRSSRRSSRRKH